MNSRQYDDYVNRLPISARSYASLTDQSAVSVSRKRNGKMPIPFFEAALMRGFDEPSKFVQFLESLRR